MYVDKVLYVLSNAESWITNELLCIIHIPILVSFTACVVEVWVI